MAEIAPPVHVLDFGYQSPSPVDYARIGSLTAAPVNQAVENYVNNQRALAIAQFQHQASLQREAMRDERMMKIAQLRSGAALEAVKSRNSAQALEKAREFLRSQVGGTTPARQPGESDADYQNRVESESDAQIKKNIEADAHAKAQARLKLDELDDWHRQNAPTFARIETAAGMATVHEAKQAAINAVRSAHPEIGPNDPIPPSLNSELRDQFDALHQVAQQKWLQQNGKLMGSVGEAFSQYKNAVGFWQNRLKSLDLMPSSTGRPVPKLWSSQSDNLADEIFAKETAGKPKAPGGVEPAPAPAPASKPQSGAMPTATPAPGVEPWSGKTGGLLGAAGGAIFLPEYQRQLADAPSIYGQGMAQVGRDVGHFVAGPWGDSTRIPAPSMQDILNFRAARDARMAAAGMTPPPQMFPQQGGFFPAPTNEPPAGPILGPRPAMPSPVMDAGTNLFTPFPAMPAALERGAALAPSAGMAPMFAAPTAFDNSEVTSPYDELYQMSRMRMLYGQ